MPEFCIICLRGGKGRPSSLCLPSFRGSSPWVQREYLTTPLVFQQDGDPSQTSNWFKASVMICLQTFGSKYLWPPSSPDVLWTMVHSGEKGVLAVRTISGDSKKKNCFRHGPPYLRKKYLPVLPPPLGVSKLCSKAKGD
ncbi:Hypothetical protein FKW44_012584, partial [Caligus rogercresseyi]